MTATRTAPRTFDHGVKLYAPGASGRWRVMWTNPDTGRRRSAERVGEQEAHDVAREVVRLLSTGRAGDDNRRRKVHELVAYYQTRPDTRTWSVAYQYRQDSMLRTWVLPAIGQLRCDQLTTDRLRTILADASDAGLQPSTLQGLASTLTGLCAAGRDGGFLSDGYDPSAGIRRQVRTVRQAGQSARFVNPKAIPSTAKVEEMAEHMAARWEWWRGLQVQTAAYTGLRLGELLALRPVDLNLEDGTIDVTRAWARKGATFTDPKWGVHRTTFITAALGAELERRCAEIGPDEPLFPKPSGGLDEQAAFTVTRFNVARVELGWPRHPDDPKRWLWTWHSLRHTFCTWALASPPHGLGLVATDVAYFAGHHSPAFTLERYASRTEGAVGRARDAAAAISR